MTPCSTAKQALVLRGQETALAGLAQIDSQQRLVLTAASKLWQQAQSNAAQLDAAQQQHSDMQHRMLGDLRYIKSSCPINYRQAGMHVSTQDVTATSILHRCKALLVGSRCQCKESTLALSPS